MNEPVLDGEVPAVLRALIAGDSVVTKDVHWVSAKGAGFAGQLLFQYVHPQEPVQQQPKLARGAGVAQGWGWWHFEPTIRAWSFLEGEADGVLAGCCVHE